MLSTDYPPSNLLLTPTPVTKPTYKTFTRLAKFHSSPSNNSNNNNYIHPFINKPTELLDSSPSYNHNHNHNNDDTPATTTTTTTTTGLQRFRPIAPSTSSYNIESDFLQKLPSNDPSQTYNTLQHFDRKDIKDLSTLELNPSSFVDNHHIFSSLSTPSKPCPTFTRITKPRFNFNNTTNDDIDSLHFNNNGLKHQQHGNGSFLLLDDIGKCHSNQADQSSLQDNMSLPPAPTKTSVSSFLLPPKLSVPPPLSLSLSVPPSAVPSLSSASSSCSSTISSSLSSSPPTSRFVFPATAAADRKDWWQGLSLAETPEEESDGQSSVGGSSEPSPCTAVAPVLPQPTFYRNPHKDNSLEGGGFGCGGEQDQSFGGLDMPFLLQPEFYHVTPPPTTSSTVGGVDHLQQNRVHVVRTPSPQPIQTGFCSISNNTVNQDGESSLQDFLGEADLPFPLPSTLQERQARQRKRAEQLRRLQAREEREARQSRRRGSSFCAGMPHPTLSLESLASLSLSSPSTTVSTPPITVPTTTATIKAPTPTRPGLLSRSNSILLASLPSQAKYSTPLTKCEETKSSDKKKLERHVGFDLTRTSVFEYEVGKECFGSRSPSPESSATTTSTSNTVKPRYSSFRLSAGRTAYGVPLSPP